MSSDKPHEIVMPQLSLSMDNGLIVQWLKKSGDFVKQGEILLFGEILRSLRSLRLTTDLVRAAKPESGKRTRAAPAGTQKDDPA